MAPRGAGWAAAPQPVQCGAWRAAPGGCGREPPELAPSSPSQQNEGAHPSVAPAQRPPRENDVIVLAQGSMVTLEPYLSEIAIPVLTSPRIGVEKARRVLFDKLAA